MLGTVHKRPPQNRGVCPVRTFKGVLQMRMFALFGTKNFGLFEIYGVSAQSRGVEPVQTFCGQGERGSIFRDFVRVSFTDGPLFIFCFSLKMSQNDGILP